MNAPTNDRPTPSFDLVVSAVCYRNRTSRRGYPWQGTLGELFGHRHALRAELRGAPAFSFAVPSPTPGEREFGALVLAYDIEADPAFLQSSFLAPRAFVLFTAFDHRADGSDSYRFRLVLPLSRPVNAEQCRVLAASLDSDLGGLADHRRERRDRRWTMPSCPAELSRFASIAYGRGARLNVDDYLGTRVFAGLRRTA